MVDISCKVFNNHTENKTKVGVILSSFKVFLDRVVRAQNTSVFRQFRHWVDWACNRDMGNVACSLTSIPMGSVVWRVYISNEFLYFVGK